MITLTETTPPAALPVPAERLAEHLRLGAGFADPSGEAALLDLYLRAATAEVEARTAQALVRRGFRVTAAAWDRCGHLRLPVGPVATVAAFAFTGGGAAVPVDPGLLALGPGRTRQRLTSRGGGALPPIPAGRVAEIDVTAGHADGPAGVPADLAEAVLLLASRLYDDRAGAATAGLPAAVAALLAPHRPLRL